VSSSAEICGQLLVVGFLGTALSVSVRKRLSAGELGGVILFRRNIESVGQVHALAAEVSACASGDVWIGIDQEGGRVARLPSPVMKLPAARSLGRSSAAVLREAGACLGRQLAGLGINLNFAPVFDVDSNPKNPVIGDRAFSRDPMQVAEFACAFALGLQAAGVAACAKHFPGHGDTHQDSHQLLPVVDRGVLELMSLEVPPFAAASTAGVAAMMTAHVLYPAWDPINPATLSAPILTGLLRDTLGFEGVLFSDDLEMGALANSHRMEEAAVTAVAAGCDALLICHSEEHQLLASEALRHEYDHSPAFRARVQQAARRGQQLRQRYPARAKKSYSEWLSSLNSDPSSSLGRGLEMFDSPAAEATDPTDT